MLALVVVGHGAQADDAAVLRRGEMQNFVLAPPGQPPPAATFANRAGADRDIGSYRGRVAVVNFFATWCVPCRQEMTSLDRLQQALGTADLVVIVISEDRGSASVVEPFLAELGITHLNELLFDDGMRGARALRVIGLPTTIVFDRAGSELGRLAGPAEWDSPEAQALLRHFIAQAGSRPQPRGPRHDRIATRSNRRESLVKIVNAVAMVLTIVGALNWGLVGLFQVDLVAAIFGGQGQAGAIVVYLIVGLAGIYGIYLARGILGGSGGTSS